MVVPESVPAKFFLVLQPAKNTASKIVGAKFVAAYKDRPTNPMTAGSIIIETEIEVPLDLFALKARAKLTADTAITIKSLREIEKDLT